MFTSLSSHSHVPFVVSLHVSMTIRKNELVVHINIIIGEHIVSEKHFQYQQRLRQIGRRTSQYV